MSREHLIIGRAFKDRHLQTLAGQPPWRDDSRFQAGRVERMLKMPGDLDVDKLLDREIYTSQGAVADLGLDSATMGEWSRFLDSIIASPEELTMRQQLFEKMRAGDWDPELRKVMFQRATSLFRNTRKSILTVDDLAKGEPVTGQPMVVLKPEQLQKAKYKRRWRGPKGEWRYEYETPEQASSHRNALAAPHIDQARAAHKRMADSFTDVRNNILIATGVGLSDEVTAESWEKAAKNLERGANALQEKNDAWDRVRRIRRDPAPDTTMRSGTPAEFREVAAFTRMRAAGLWPDELPVGIHYLGSEATNNIIRKWNEHIAEKQKTEKKIRKVQKKAAKEEKSKSKQLGLFKAQPRGGTYHRRVPYTAKGGKQKFRYYYDPEKYNQTKDAHQSGEEMVKYAMGQSLVRALKSAGDKGCSVEELKDLAKKYGGKELSKTLRERCGKGGDMSYSNGRFYSRKKENDDG